MTEKISWLQYLVVAKSLLMASKGPAVDYLEARSRRQTSTEDGGEGPYLHQELVPKLLQLGKNAIFVLLLFRNIKQHYSVDFSGKQMPFYFFLTTFRVLSISLVIVSLPYTFLILYPLFVLGIVILGYLKTSKQDGFLVRGMRSMVTTGKSFK